MGCVYSVNDEVLARAAYWPEPLKYLPLKDPDLTVERNEEDILRVRVKRPAKGVFFSADKELSWSDNMLDMLPDDEQRIHVQGLGEAPIKIVSILMFQSSTGERKLWQSPFI